MKMDLREYLFRKRIQIKDFSNVVGYCRQHISDIVNSRRRPSKRLAEAIEQATNNEVTAEELLNKKLEEKQ
jgi:DNA-binding transcriptional regulator YdaS (Cro superfamily)